MQLSTFMTFITIFKDNYFTPRPVVKVPGVGTLRGTTVKSSMLRRDIHGFWGVPYAAPPTGARRFQPPAPAPPIPGEFDAGQLRFVLSPRSCSQAAVDTNVLNTIVRGPPQVTVRGSEDCLNLAVFTPNLRPKKLMPVMVFIHGGAYILGSYTVYGPHFLLDKDVVLVNIHYRLSSLGFLCLNTPESHSNVGLLDQVLALQWVQKHIRSFGGDPSRVTVSGESAGGASVTYLMTSPAARGLFSKAFISSGSNLTPWALNKHPQERAVSLGRILDCPSHDVNIMIRCIKYSRSSEQIIRAQDTLRRRAFKDLQSIGQESAPCVDYNFYPPR